jgi:ABC-2 type transport system ATP-binding protein
MILVDSLSRQFGDFVAVNQVSFKIGKGEIVGLLGHNGAGKTTIMKMLTGYLEPDNGVISMGGKDITQQAEAVKAMIGYLPENLPMYPEMLVADYLEYVAGLRGLRGQQKWQAVLEAIEQTELQAKSIQPISTLSRGYKQRVGVAQAILHKPTVLILDEPTNGLDPTQTMHMRHLIKRYSEHATIILSTHIMQEVEAVCDRVIILGNGQLLVDEQLSDFARDNTLLLHTDTNVDIIKTLLDGLEDISNISLKEQQDDSYTYLLKLAEDADPGQTASTITQAVVNAGHQLFAIYPHKRDLEMLFREVNTSKEITDVV